MVFNTRGHYGDGAKRSGTEAGMSERSMVRKLHARRLALALLLLLCGGAVLSTGSRAAHTSPSGDGASVTGGALATLLNEITVDGIEVTQSVQSIDHSVTLVAGKRTVVRAYVSCQSAGTVTVKGSLSVRRAAGGPVTEIASLNSPVINPAQNGQVRPKRENIERSLNFLLPLELTTSGPLFVNLSAVTEAASGGPLPCVNCATKSTTPSPVQMVDSPPLRVRIIGLRYNLNGRVHTPRDLDFNLIDSWLLRAYPAPQLISSRTVVPSSSAATFTCGTANAQIAAIRRQDIQGGADRRTHFYGLVSDTGFFMRGCSSVPPRPNPSAVGSGPTGRRTFGWDSDGSYGDWYTGHELGHTFGRHHPGFCGQTHDDPNYPFPGGQLSGANGAFTGFNFGDLSAGSSPIPMAALPGTRWHDVMTYCVRQWLSSYTYMRIRSRLVAEDALRSDGVNAAQVDPEGLAENLQTGDFVNVVARVNVTRRTGRIVYVNRLTKALVTESTVDGRAKIRVTDINGRATEYPAILKLDTDIPRGRNQTALVDEAFPSTPGTAKLELLLDGKVLDTIRVSKSAPVVRNLSLSEGRTGGRGARARSTPVVTWEANDPDGGTLTYTVLLSYDGGATWETAAVGLSMHRLELSPSNMKNTDSFLVRVIASDGFNSSEGSSGPLSLRK
jgi:hypothetical protein